jgi:hypothetical protein
MNGAWTVVAGLLARCNGSVRSSSESDRVGVPEHLNHARGAQYWHSTRFGASDREEEGIEVHRHDIALCWQYFFWGNLNLG